MTCLGGNFPFNCESINNNVSRYQWLVNMTLLENLDRTDGVISTNTNNIISLINFENVTMKYNGTTIECIVTLTSREMIRSNNATLLVQGEPILFLH